MAEASIEVLLSGYAFGTDSGTPGFCGVFLIRDDGRRILVDTAHVGRRLSLQLALQARGLREEDVDIVVMTHAHWDHVQNIDLFPAPILIHADERRYVHRPHRNDWATPGWTGAVIERSQLVEVGEDYKVSPHVRILDMPGHSPGSIGVAVETAAGLAVLAGDAIHTRVAALNGRNPLVFWNERQANESLRRVIELADVVYPGHDRPFRVANGELEYIEPFALTLTGLRPNRRGLVLEEPTPERAREVWIMPGIGEQRLP